MDTTGLDLSAQASYTKRMKVPLISVAVVAVLVTVWLHEHIWALTASWVLVGLLAHFADRRWEEAERLIARLPLDKQEQVRGHERLETPMSPELAALVQETRPDTLH